MNPEIVSELLNVRNELRRLKSREAELKKQIMNEMKQRGLESTNISHNGNNYLVKYTKKDYSKIDEEKIKKLLKDKNLWDEAKITVEQVDEVKVFDLMNAGKITADEIRENAMKQDYRYRLDVKILK